MQQRPEWRYVGSVFGDPDLAVINRDAVDAVWRAFVGETGARDQLIRTVGRRDPLSPPTTDLATMPARWRTGTMMSACA